jgi:hypothetical protein
VLKKALVLAAALPLLLAACKGKSDPGADLIQAAGKGDTAAVKSLIAKRADVNARSSSGYTALMVAIDGGHAETVRALLEGGADANAKTNDGYSPLMHADDKGDLGIATALLDKGADANAKNNDGWTALMTAADRGHADIVTILLGRGADRNATNAAGETALDRAKAGGDAAAVRLLGTTEDYLTVAWEGNWLMGDPEASGLSALVGIGDVYASGFRFVVEATYVGATPHMGELAGTARFDADGQGVHTSSGYPDYSMVFRILEGGQLSISELNAKTGKDYGLSPEAGANVRYSGEYTRDRSGAVERLHALTGSYGIAGAGSSDFALEILAPQGEKEPFKVRYGGGEMGLLFDGKARKYVIFGRTLSVEVVDEFKRVWRMDIVQDPTDSSLIVKGDLKGTFQRK